jgi:hypothetical protein
LDAALRTTLENLPVQVSTRQESWRYLGFKHVNGPARWGSYAKAQYIAQVHNEHKVSLQEIANQIGDTHKTVQRLYRGLMVIKQAEKAGVFDREDIFHSSLAFSHLYTGLQYDGFKSFLQISAESDEKEDPVPNDNIERLKQLLTWLYGSKKYGIPPLVRSQNPDLRYLERVLKSDEAIRAVERGASLGAAVELTEPAPNVFRGALYDARDSLRKARSMVTDGYDGSEETLRLAGSVAVVAASLYDDMERMHSGKPKERLTEEG